MRPRRRSIIHSRAAAITIGLLAGLATTTSALARGKLLVTDVNDQSRRLDGAVLETLGRAIRARAAKTARYAIVDASLQASTLARLRGRDKKSCADGCPLALAQELGATAILGVTVNQSGSDLTLVGELIDARRQTAIKTAQGSVPATADGLEDRLLGAGRALVDDLLGAGTADRPSERRTEAAERRREARVEAVDQRRLARDQALGRRSRNFKLIYGVSALAGAALAGGLGAYYLTKGIGDAEAQANQATSPSGLKSAADAASSARTKGIVMLGLGAAALAVGAYLIFSMPRVPAAAEVAGVRLELPAPVVVAGGAGVSWGGAF